jgi:hypothetical protein
MHTEVQPGDVDLLDFAVEHALLHGGEAYVVEPEEVPGAADKSGPGPVSVLLRWKE